MAEWGEPKNSKLIGKRIPRLSGPDKVTGRAKYTYDINRPRMLYGAILHSSIARGRIRSIDVSKAESMKGVIAINVIAKVGSEIRYHGQEIIALAAETRNIANDALRAIKIDYEILPHVVEIDTAISENSPQIRNWTRNQSKHDLKEKGDLEAGFAQADQIVEATYSTEVQTHVCLETHGSVAEWNGDQLTVWCSTQAVFGVRNAIARHFKIPHEKIRVITEHMGGGFGSKFGPGTEGIQAIELARKTGRPVKMMLDRKAEHLIAGNRPSMIQHVRAGATKDGKLIAYDLKGYGSAGMGGGSNFQGPYVYRVPNFRSEKWSIALNAGGARAFRAPGHPQGAFAMDSLMDELAEAINIDPLEFRIKNDPSEMRRGEYELGAKEIGWHRRNKIAGSGSDAKKRGIGVGSGQWWGGGGKGTKARVNIHSDGSVEAICGTQDLGTGIRTVIAIIVADELGLDPDQISVKIGDTAPELQSGGSGGSQTTPSVSPVIKTAVIAAKKSLFDRLSQNLGVDPESISAENGKIFADDEILSWHSATKLLGVESVSEEGFWDENLREGGAAGTQFVEVEVDTETGFVKLIKIVAIQDCGLILNRLTVESQINGGVIGGLNFALYENRVMDPQTGRMLNPNMIDYKIAGSVDIPEIVPIGYDTDQKVTGIGEPTTIPTAGAIANAIHNAIGVRIRSLPITPDKILMALAESEV